jgi:DNA-directed RNA polymerase sigma subunit (sigma70/sigma32)
MTLTCPLSDQQISTEFEALASGLNLDPPISIQRMLAAKGEFSELARQHHWLVVGIALKHTSGEHEITPALRALITAGYRGIHKANQSWDPARGYKFGTWASWWIRQAIAASLKDSDS